MAKSLSRLFIRRYQILTVFCSLVIAILLICLDSSSWRTIETNDIKLLSHLYSPFQHGLSRYTFNNENKTFKLNVGPLWRCLTTKFNGIITKECTINTDSFDYIIISIGIGAFIFYTIISICIISQCLTYRIKILRLCMSFILELAALWLIYGFFHIQRVLGPLYGWASIGFFIGIINVIVICVLEWDAYFRDVYITNCCTTEINKNETLNAWVSETIHTDIDQI
jgi:hypothetical protein